MLEKLTHAEQISIIIIIMNIISNDVEHNQLNCRIMCTGNDVKSYFNHYHFDGSIGKRGRREGESVDRIREIKVTGDLTEPKPISTSHSFSYHVHVFYVI